MYYRQDVPPVPKLAVARLQGGPIAPNLTGEVMFEEIPEGVMVTVYVKGLPPFQRNPNGNPIGPHGFHIHENGTCEVGDPNNPFTSAGNHWNPDNQPHGNHAGDFPNLFSMNGTSYMIFFTNRFKIDQIIGKSIIVHEGPDDSIAQPSGNSGRRLACGIIELFDWSMVQQP